MRRSPHLPWDLLLETALGIILPVASQPLRIGVLRAKAGCGLPRLAAHPRCAALRVQSGFRADVLALRQEGLEAVDGLDGPLDLLLFVPGKHRVEGLALFARAREWLAPGGLLLAAAAKDGGGETYERRLADLSGTLWLREARAHCRLFGARQGPWDETLARRWAEAATPVRRAHGFVTVPGLYNWDKVDTGSALLAEALPTDLTGEGMNLACNWGWLAHAALTRAPGIGRLHAMDGEARAIACAQENLAPFGGRVQFHWRDIGEPLPEGMDFVVLNPPFHEGLHDDHALGRRFVEKACHSLRRRGRLFLVANVFLPYEEVLARGLAEWQVIRRERGYKVLVGRK